MSKIETQSNELRLKKSYEHVQPQKLAQLLWQKVSPTLQQFTGLNFIVQPTIAMKVSSTLGTIHNIELSECHPLILENVCFSRWLNASWASNSWPNGRLRRTYPTKFLQKMEMNKCRKQYWEGWEPVTSKETRPDWLSTQDHATTIECLKSSLCLLMETNRTILTKDENKCINTYHPNN